MNKYLELQCKIKFGCCVCVCGSYLPNEFLILKHWTHFLCSTMAFQSFCILFYFCSSCAVLFSYISFCNRRLADADLCFCVFLYLALTVSLCSLCVCVCDCILYGGNVYCSQRSIMSQTRKETRAGRIGKGLTWLPIPTEQTSKVAINIEPKSTYTIPKCQQKPAILNIYNIQIHILYYLYIVYGTYIHTHSYTFVSIYSHSILSFSLTLLYHFKMDSLLGIKVNEYSLYIYLYLRMNTEYCCIYSNLASLPARLACLSACLCQ